MKTFQKLAVVSVMLSAGYAGLASAHEIPGTAVSTTLGAALNLYDVYHMTCYADTIPVDPESVSSADAKGLRGGVSLTAAGTAGANVKLTIGKNNTKASCNDTVVTAGGYTYPNNYCATTANGGTTGTQAYVAGGNGEYDLVVSHNSTTTGTLTYNVVAHCEDTAGVHTGTGANLTYNAGATIVNGVVTGTVNTLPVTHIQVINN